MRMLLGLSTTLYTAIPLHVSQYWYQFNIQYYEYSQVVSVCFNMGVCTALGLVEGHQWTHTHLGQRAKSSSAFLVPQLHTEWLLLQTGKLISIRFNCFKPKGVNKCDYS